MFSLSWMIGGQEALVEDLLSRRQNDFPFFSNGGLEHKESS